MFFLPRSAVSSCLSNLPDFSRLASDPEIIPGGISSWAFNALKVTGSVAELMASRILVVFFIFFPFITIVSNTVTTIFLACDIAYDCEGEGCVENQRFC
jgi:hypothetical protein